MTSWFTSDRQQEKEESCMRSVEQLCHSLTARNYSVYSDLLCWALYFKKKHEVVYWIESSVYCESMGWVIILMKWKLRIIVTCLFLFFFFFFKIKKYEICECCGVFFFLFFMCFILSSISKTSWFYFLAHLWYLLVSDNETLILDKDGVSKEISFWKNRAIKGEKRAR